MRRLFGTNGIRGIPGKDLTPQFCVEIGASIGTFLKDRVAVGGDTRLSTPYVKNAVISGLLASGCDVIDVGTLPTPALQYYCKKNFIPGVMITASHNPPEYNGIKVIGKDGTEIARSDEEIIENIYFSKKYELVNWTKVGNIYCRDACRYYIEDIVYSVDSDAIKNKNFTVALDCGNGAGCYTSPYILDRLNVRVFCLNCNPDGRFSARLPEPRPENLEILIDFIKDNSVDLGAAHDGDADRVSFMDENGNFIQGDVILALFAKYYVERGFKTIVTPVSTSKVVEDVVKEVGGRVVYTRVGAPIVARKMIELDAKFGGEENGGYIFGDFQFCRDGGFALAKLLEILSRENRPLYELVGEIPKYYQAKISVRCPEKLKELVLIRLKEILYDERVDFTDGVKIVGEDFAILIRPSGTEEIYRIYCEAKNETLLNDILSKYRKIVEEVINELSNN